MPTSRTYEEFDRLKQESIKKITAIEQEQFANEFANKFYEQAKQDIVN